MRTLLKLFIAMLLLSGSVVSGQAAVTRYPVFTEVQKDTLPVPKNIKNLLFYVQRDPNINTVIYELNLTPEGKVNEKEPVKIYWIRYAEKGEHKELNYFQRKLAYGLDVKKLSATNFELRFVCYPKLAFYLSKDTNGKYHVYTDINQKKAILNRAFVRIKGGTFWVPNVVHVNLFGREAATGKEISTRFKP